MAFQADAVAQPVGEVGAVAALLDDPPGRPVDVPQRHAGAHRVDARLVGGFHQGVNPPFLLARLLKIDGAGHVAPIPPDGGENVENHAVAGLDHVVSGGVVRVGGVGAEADQLRPVGHVRPILQVCPIDQGGQLGLHRPVGQGADGGFHHDIVDFGGPAQGVPLRLVLVAPRRVDGAGTQHRPDVGAVFHDADKELTGPEFVLP